VINFQQEAIDRFIADLKRNYQETYGLDEPEYGNVLAWVGQLALENISNTDALYHNMEHTMLVAQVAQAVLRGKHLREGGVKPLDWLHCITASLCHDIGYVRGICRADREGVYATGVADALVSIPDGGTDASLTPYHVDRSQLFVRERFQEISIARFDVEQVCRYIEGTRFAGAELDENEDTFDYPALVRASDFIGQLGDPHYLRKIPALYYEFHECGFNQLMGYANPNQMRSSYARFFWASVAPRIQGALHYLGISYEGRQWISSLYAHVFSVEHGGSVQTVRERKAVIYE